MARSMLKAKGMPAKFWGEAVTTAVYLLNRSPTRSVEEKTPYEVWHGEKPSVQHIRVFGCVAHVKTARPMLKKLDDRSTPMVFIGYEEGTKGYRVFNPGTGRVHVSRDVVFDEGACWKWDDAAAAPEPFTVSYTVSVTRPESLEDGGAAASPAARSPAWEPVTPGPAGEDTVAEGDAAPLSEARSDADAEGSDRARDQGGHPMLTRSKDGIHQRNTKYDDDQHQVRRRLCASRRRRGRR
jgi:hypothetical protein